MSEVACFYLEPTFRARRGLRRYVSGAYPDIPPCPTRFKYHNALVWIDEIAAPIGADGIVQYAEGVTRVEPFLADPRWPSACACGYVFDERAEFQIFTDQIYRRTDTGELTTLRDAGPGAIWNAAWLSDWSHYRGPDGRSLVVRLPNGHDWQIDGIASNCDAPCQDCGRPMHLHFADTETRKANAIECRKLNPRPHKCWIRHGEPGTPSFHVDKNGVTCNAGAGSILAGNYHGFLHHGHLREC
jgi:hypothetical protein